MATLGLRSGIRIENNWHEKFKMEPEPKLPKANTKFEMTG